MRIKVYGIVYLIGLIYFFNWDANIKSTLLFIYVMLHWTNGLLNEKKNHGILFVAQYLEIGCLLWPGRLVHWVSACICNLHFCAGWGRKMHYSTVIIKETDTINEGQTDCFFESVRDLVFLIACKILLNSFSWSLGRCFVESLGECISDQGSSQLTRITFFSWF